MIPDDGHFEFWLPLGKRLAVGAANVEGGHLAFAIAAPGEPLVAGDMTPLAVLDIDTVAQLRDDLTHWLGRQWGLIPNAADPTNNPSEGE